MIICGVKLTHDGGVALIDDGRLVFSVEMEKLANNPRHQRIDDLEIVSRLLAEYGYRLADVDRFVVDGWRKTHKVKPWGGQETLIDLAPYRRGLVDDNLLRPYVSRMLDLEYTSYPHYAGHVASAYCSSPFSRAAEPSYVLCWDGAMFPFLYHYDPSTQVMESLGAVHHMLGDTYHTLAMACPPFDAPLQWPHTLALPGKIMAYIAHGTADEGVVESLQVLLREAEREVFGTDQPDDDRLTEAAGRRILARMKEELDCTGARPADVLASIHTFLGRALVDGLKEKIAADGRGTRNLCLVGGCALNIKWNSDIRASGIADTVWVPPFPNDAGSALGAACCELLRSPGPVHLEWDTYAGPALVPSEPMPGWAVRPCSAAELAGRLHESGDPVVVLHGRAELGPRALGHRSILAPASDPGMKDRLNDVKGRERYRPVAPICLEARAPEVFTPGVPDPYMLFEHEVRPDWQNRVPAVVHLDGTARVQTVGPRDDPFVFEVLTDYERLSGIPLLCNTSANLNGSGFFPDVRSAMRWGRVPAVWSDGMLYERA
ncbi:carbamoyltransferase N-terminal domain-containing protein [Streptomyces sp. NBC_01358]|uniref:carbamoyltransferase N-terminal domain-containing protein n=1 Tax=Streptomyces sp. NBC_01358 TaxID=2903837 RepID=UPI002E3331D6|nr:carbamoyltransferase N-terminal domain-containing protein [Streptomyces sp. NBC_01358]